MVGQARGRSDLTRGGGKKKVLQKGCKLGFFAIFLLGKSNATFDRFAARGGGDNFSTAGGGGSRRATLRSRYGTGTYVYMHA